MVQEIIGCAFFALSKDSRLHFQQAMFIDQAIKYLEPALPALNGIEQQRIKQHFDLQLAKVKVQRAEINNISLNKKRPMSFAELQLSKHARTLGQIQLSITKPGYGSDPAEIG